MRGNTPKSLQRTLFQSLKDLINPKNSLYKYSINLPWEEKAEKEFAPLHSKIGRPSKQ